MCIYCKNMKPKIADHDIVTYKLMIHRYNVNSWTFESYVRGFKYTLGKTYTEALFPDLLREHTVRGDEMVYASREGFYTWESFGRAKDEIRPFRGDLNGRVIVRCIIPKGTRYYCDNDEFGCGRTFCSEKIIIDAYYRQGAHPTWVSMKDGKLVEHAE